MSIAFLIAIALLFPAPPLLAQATAMIDGNVMAEDGRPVAGAAVIANRVAPPSPVVAMSVLSGAAGAFTMTGLAPGVYRLCVQAPASEYLDPCFWSAQPPTLRLAAGQTAAGQRIVVARGSFVRIRIQDPAKRLKRDTATGKAPSLLLGVWTPSRLFVPMRMNAEDDAGKNFQVLAPFDLDLRLAVSSASVELEDDRQQKLSGGGAVMQVRQARQDSRHKSIVLRVR